MSLTNRLRFAVCVLFSTFSTAIVAVEIEVVEGEPDAVVVGESSGAAPVVGSTLYQTQAPARTFQADTQTEMLLQLQSLQDEVRMLRGQVEEQSYQIQQLKRQAREDYMALDERIGNSPTPRQPTSSAATPVAGPVSSVEDQSAAPAISSVSENGSVGTTAGSVGVDSVEQQPVVAVQSSNTDNVVKRETRVISNTDDSGRDAYKAAYNLVKTRDFDDARVSMIAFIADYPQHKYVPNAHFWLGELYYHDSDLVNSRDHFAVLVDVFPAHRKVADAKFKLAKVEHQLGDARKAKRLLRSVVKDHSESRVAKPAREYLENSL